MNGGNMQRGQADGFGLEILAKLKDVKSKGTTFPTWDNKWEKNNYNGSDFLNWTLCC